MFRLLGPVRLERDGETVDLGPSKQRGLLAALLLTPGRAVSMDLLIDRLWGENPPRDGRGVLATYVSRLRRVVTCGPGGARESAPVHIRHVEGGYRIECEDDGVDLHRARRLAREARGALQAEDTRRSLQLLDAALADWQSEALAGISGDWAARIRGSLLRERLDLLADRAEVAQALGQHAEVVAELRLLVAEQPTAERLAGQLMLALARTGRSAEALDCYARTRRAIVDDLGTEPSPQLRDLHLKLLRGETATPDPAGRSAPAGAAGTAAGRGREAEPVVPAQLPADVAAFTGREAELAVLDGFLDRLPNGGQGQPPGAVVVSALSGTAGVGKTALAVHWGHRVRDRFPDGQLYVNLRGYDPDQPASASDALAGFLTALGVASRDLPSDVAGRAALFRTSVAGRRMLVVLDNASSATQVRPLLPGTGPAMALVTSRDSLSSLVALDGAERLDLDLLPIPDAVALLRRLIGERADADPAATAALADQCARLPLALRVAAELAAARPGTSLRDLVTELSDQQLRLELLDLGEDPWTAVSAVFSWSVRNLPPDIARMFALLGLHPGPEIDAWATAALAGTEVDAARHGLQVLARAHLVQACGADRYTMHDLLSAYAARLAGPVPGTDGAITRLLDYYVAAAAAAMDLAYPPEAHYRPRIPPAGVPIPALSGRDQALAWLDTERAGLVAAVGSAAAHDRPAHVHLLATTVARYLDVGAHHDDALAVHSQARDIARRANDRGAEAHALLGLGGVYWDRAEHVTATAHFEEALALFERTGDRIGQARAHSSLGLVAGRTGRHEQAVQRLEHALTLFGQAGDRFGQARTLLNLGIIEAKLGRWESAADRNTRALAEYHVQGERIGEGFALAALGDLELQHGRHRSAVRYLERGLAVSREIGNQVGEAWALDSLGVAFTGLGQPGEASGFHRQAAAIFRRIRHRDGEAWAVNGLGEAALADGDVTAAIAHHTDALDVAGDDLPEQQARAYAGLATAQEWLGDTDLAVEHLRRALDLYVELGMPEADTTRARLTALEREAGAAS